MNKIFLLTYELHDTRKPYGDFYVEIRNSSIDYFHVFEDAWTLKVENTVTAHDLYKKFKPFMTDNDAMFIVDITSTDKNGWCPSSFWKWLKKDKTNNENTNR